MVYGVIALQEGYGIIIDHIQRIYWWRSAYVMLQALSFDILLCGTVGPWVKVPKALEEDTPMWVYGVGSAPGF